nr:hypothetical protein [Draconibacterium sediminis]
MKSAIKYKYNNPIVPRRLNSKSGETNLNPCKPMIAPLMSKPTIDGIRILSKKTGPMSKITRTKVIITTGSLNGNWIKA